MATIVRAGESADVDALGRIHVRAWQAAYRGAMPDAYLDALDPRERSAMWARFFEREGDDQRLRVVVDADVVVGFACFGASRDSDDDDIGELHAINVDPTSWGRGVGRTLLSAVTVELAEFGAESVLWVLPSNARARSLYESAGWTDDRTRRTDDVLGARVEEMRYRRSQIM